MIELINEKKFNSINILKDLENLKSTRKKLWNISWETGVLINLLTLTRNPKSILEIGTSNGFSTIWLAKDCECKVYTIEIREEIIKEAEENFKKAKLDNIKILKGKAKEILNTYNFNTKFDLIFIDANKKEYIEYIKILEEKKLLNKNCLVIADNIISHKTTKEFFEYVQNKYKTYLINIGKGISVSIIK